MKKRILLLFLLLAIATIAVLKISHALINYVDHHKISQIKSFPADEPLPKEVSPQQTEIRNYKFCSLKGHNEKN